MPHSAPPRPHTPDHGTQEGTAHPMTAQTRRLPTLNGDTPVTLTITGLPDHAVAAVAEFADSLTQQINTVRRTWRAAHRIARSRQSKQPTGDVHSSEADRLELDRRCEERTRPATVELYVSPAGSAVVRFLNTAGHVHGGRDVVRLGGMYTGPHDRQARTAAAAETAKRGFTAAGTGRLAWTKHATGAARAAIQPTADYLSHVARQFGPAPEIPQVEGLTATATRRGWWEVTGGRETYWLTWSPALSADRWTVWGGIPCPDQGVRPARLVASTCDVAEALDAITTGK